MLAPRVVSREDFGVTERRILFVCAGNTCRSPLAAALAMHHLPNVAAESAGTYPGYSVAPHTVALAAELADIDLISHLPRDVRDVDLASFDLIVALDSMVAEDLKDVLPPGEQVISWGIRDPFGETLDVYRACADEILRRLPELVE